MAQAEMIDFFSEPAQREGFADLPDINLDEEIFSPGRSRLNDFKHSANSVQRGKAQKSNFSAENYSSPAPEMQASSNKKTYIDMSDERVVWAGAIFVFFGVLIFLVGYWLGGRTVKDVTESGQSYRQKVEQRLEQKKLENALSITPPVNDPVKADTALLNPPILTQPQAQSPISAIKEAPRPVIETPPVAHTEPVKQTATGSGVTLGAKKTVKPAKTVVKTAAKPAVAKVAKPASVTGNYTIQVSANSSMEKARTVEDAIRKLGFQAYLVEATVNGTTYYRVRAGKFGGKSEAQTALAKIKGTSLGKESFILNLN